MNVINIYNLYFGHNNIVYKRSIICCVYILLYLKEQIMQLVSIRIIYNLCLSIVDAEQHQRIRTAKKQQVAEGDESEIANMTRIATKGIICCYIGLFYKHKYVSISILCCYSQHD